MEKIVAAMMAGIFIMVLLMFSLAFRMKLEAEAARNYANFDVGLSRRIELWRLATLILGVLLLADLAAIGVLSVGESRDNPVQEGIEASTVDSP